MPISRQILEQLQAPWMESLKDPIKAQSNALFDLLQEYRRTGYGRDRGSDGVTSIEEYRRAFPILNYYGFHPMVRRALIGDYSYLCSDKPVTYVMTRGTTGEPKVIPCTPAHLDKIFECGARAIINEALRAEDLSLVEGYVLNLNFPSEVFEVVGADGTIKYGYSSGTYARLKPTLGLGGLVPPQERIDSLGPGIKVEDWNRRFEMVYQETRDLPVVAVMGVTPVILSFANYVRRRHGHSPRDLWRMKVLFCTSVAKIQSEYGPQVQRLFGQAPVREIYSATEGVFAQQLDEYPYVVPNFDSYFFEVKIRNRVKMLHEMKRGEWGRLVVSTPILPRYDIGDMIECLGSYYYRVFGRAKPLVVLEHVLYRIVTGWAT